MQEMMVNERVSVLTGNLVARHGTRLEVYKVRWQGTDYRVRQQTAAWKSHEGRELVEHITVKTGAGDVLWLLHNRLKDEWWLEKITLV